MRIDGMLFAATLLASSATAVAQTTLPPASADWFILGTQPTGTFGSVASAGDVDGDGYDDVAIDDSGYDGAFINSGRITIHRGSASGLSADPAWTVEGSSAHANLTSLVRAGDVNGDGLDDAFIRGRLYLGSAAGPVPSSWTGGPGIVYFVGTGDLNGDGFDDLVFLLDRVVINVFHGSPAGLPSAPSTVLQRETRTPTGPETW